MNGSERDALEGMRIGLFGKGGCGKSTAAVLLAKALVRRGYRVCVLDADSTNVGLYQALGFNRAPKALLDYYGGMVFSGGPVTCPVDDPTPLAGADINVDELPGDYHVEKDERLCLLTAGKIGDLGPGAGCDGPISKIARDLRLHGLWESAVTLVDFKAGFEDSARGAVTSLDWALVVVDPSSAAFHMAANMKTMIEKIQAGTPPATAHLETPDLVQAARETFKKARIRGLLVILNRVGDRDRESYMKTRLEENGITSLGTIHEDPSISRAWLKGMPLEENGTVKDAEDIVDALEVAVRTPQVATGAGHGLPGEME